MPDREKVINEIGELLNGYPVFIPEAAKRGLSDAIALLKEQEAFKPVRDEKTGRIWLCGNCGSYVGFEDNDPHDPNEYDNYCRKCGKPVLWEGR